jgi:hypothetical protein
MFTLIQCKKSGEKSVKNQKVEDDRDVKLPVKEPTTVKPSVKLKTEVLISTNSGINISMRPELWKTIIKLSGGVNNLLSRGILKHPAFKELLKIVTNPDVAGIEKTVPIQGAFFFGDEDGWKKSFLAINKLSKELFKDKAEIPWKFKISNPYQKKLFAIIQKAPWIQHRLILTLKKSKLFSKFIKDALKSVASTACPLKDGKILDGIYATDKLPSTCKAFTSFKNGTPSIIALSREGGIFVALRIYNKTAQVDVLTLASNLKELNFNLNTIARAIDRKITVKPSIKANKDSILTISSKWESFALANILNGVLTGIAALDVAQPKSRVLLFKEVMKLISFQEHFEKNGSFLASGATLKLSKSNQILMNWKLTKSGKYIFGNLLNQKEVLLNSNLINRIALKSKAMQLKRKSKMGKVHPAKVIGCGMGCSIECFNRLALECWIPPVAVKGQPSKPGIDGFMKMALNPIIPLLKSPKLHLSKQGNLVLTATLNK